MTALSDIEKEKILQLFDSGMNCAQIANLVGRSKDGVWSFVKRTGRDTSRSVYTLISPEDVEAICAAYKNGQTMAEILKSYPSIKADKTIAKILRDHNIPIRHVGKTAITDNEQYFQEIDSEQKAYLLGLLMADGYVIYPNAKTPKNPFWGITLHQSDEFLLEKIKVLIGSNKKIYRQRNESILTIVSKQMVEDLAKYGIVPRKSFSLRFPFNIPRSLWRHVLRGVFDGDGCISGKICTFYGNKDFLAQVRTILWEELKIPQNKITERARGVGAASFSFSAKKDVENFYHYIYDDATIFLPRKREKFISNHGLVDNQC